MNDALKQSEAELAAMTVEGVSLENTIKEIEESRQTVLKEVTTAELDLTELKRSSEKREEMMLRNQQKRQTLEQELGVKQARLAELTPQLIVRAVGVVDV